MNSHLATNTRVLDAWRLRLPLRPMWMQSSSVALALSGLMLAGCDLPGFGPDPKLAQRDAEARAIGSACRHALRGLEDCYALNARAGKAAVFAGWKDMDQYMRDNKIDGTPSLERSTQTAGDASVNEVASPASKTGGDTGARSSRSANRASQS